MLNKMIAAHTKNLVFAIAILMASYPVQAQEDSGNLSCIVEQSDAEGDWLASRDLTVSEEWGNSTRDTYEWRPKEGITFGPGMTLKWVISYYWPTQAAAQEAIPEDEVTVILNFWYDARYVDAPLKKPERTWIHLYRSVKPEEEFRSTTSSLTGVMFWDQFNNGNLSTKAVIPLDHLLAFGTGFDTLVWNIRTEPNQFGGTRALAKGVIPIAAMRGKISEIPKLRRMLDKKAANFRAECHAPIMVDYYG